MKPASSLSGARDPIVIPRGATKVDWEVELCVVIGSRAKHVLVRQVPSCIARFCIVNDVSERAFQLEGTGQGLKGKVGDTLTLIGRYVLAADEVADLQVLDLWLRVNGVASQRSNTRQMIFGIRFLVSYISRFMTLLPGDLISMGTPPGMGLGMQPPSYLRPVNVVRLGITCLGEQEQRILEEGDA